MKKLAVVVAMSLLVLLAVVLRSSWGAEEAEQPAIVSKPDTIGTALPGGEAENDTSPPTRFEVADPTTESLDSDAPRVYPASRGTGSVVGRVLEPEGAPLAGVAIVACPYLGWVEGLRVADERAKRTEMRSGEDGRFTLKGLPAGQYGIEFRAGRGLINRRIPVVRENVETPLGDVTLTVDEHWPYEFVVDVHDSSGAPVAGAEVEIVGGVSRRAYVGGLGTPAVTGRSGPKGRVVFPDFHVARATITALAKGGHIGAAYYFGYGNLSPWGHVRVTIAEPAGFSGAAPPNTEGGEVLAHRRVDDGHFARRRTGYAERTWRSDIRAGRFAFAGLPAGQYALALVDAAGQRHSLGDSGVLEITLEPGDNKIIHLAIPPSARLTGLVLGRDGQPISRATIVVRPSEQVREFTMVRGVVVAQPATEALRPVDPTHVWQLRTDDRGRYSFAALPPGEWNVVVLASGRTRDVRTPVTLAIDRPVELLHRLAPDGALQIAVPKGVARVHLESADHAVTVRAISDVVLVTGIAAGYWDVHALTSRKDGEGKRVHLGSAELVAGRTTWCDFTEAIPPNVRGRVLGPDGPLPSIEVRLSYDYRTTTDDQGRFSFTHLGAASIAADTSNSTYITAVLGGVSYGLRMGQGVFDGDRWEGDIRLGRFNLDIRTIDDGGSSTPASIHLFGPTRNRPQIPLVNGTKPSGSDGVCRFDRLPPGNYQITVKFASGLKRTLRQELTGSDTLTVPAVPVGTVRVRVLGADGRPMSQIPVIIRRWHGSGPPTADAESFAQHSSSIAGNTGSIAEKGWHTFAGVSSGSLLVGLGWPLAGNAQKPPGYEGRDRFTTELKRIELPPNGAVDVELRANLR